MRQNILRALNYLINRSFIFLIIGLLAFMSSYPTQALGSYLEGNIVEYLRLKVTENTKEAWLKAENDTWGPWLVEQNGFIGRQLLWDKESEEATILISWSTRNEWKSIPSKDIEHVQARFEKVACQETGYLKENPFPLIFEGELIPQ